MTHTKRKCDYCDKEYMADNRNLKRGWGLCCSKKCAANKRERSKPNYNPERFIRNNKRRENWVENGLDNWARSKGYESYDDYCATCEMELGWNEHKTR